MTRSALERLRRRYNRREFVHPDPIEFLHACDDPLDREVAGLIASCLAFGRVVQILRSVRLVLDRMRPSPRRYVLGRSERGMQRDFAGFRHRFASDADLLRLLVGMRRLLETHRSLEAAFSAGMTRRDATVRRAMEPFAASLCPAADPLIPRPSAGSACKRLNLFLRWMVRRDEVDPGGWTRVSPRQLIVPLDTHMQRIATELGFTRRRTPDMAMALEITAAFRFFAPDDPVRYDFALTRFGIRSELRPESLGLILAGGRR